MKKILILLVLVLLLIACGVDTDKITNTNSVATATNLIVESSPMTVSDDDDVANGGYPSQAVSTIIEPYPDASVLVNSVPVILSDDSQFRADMLESAVGTGIVMGRMIDDHDNRPGQLRVYLAKRIESDSGEGYLIGIEKGSSSYGDTNEQGYFVITNAEPGIYALVVWTPYASKPLIDPVTQQEYWVDISDGDVIELDPIRYTLP